MPDASNQILIAGAGVAGLTAALAFAGHGYSVRVFERAPQLEEVGAGLQLSPNATRLLAALGLAEALRAASTRPEAIVLRSGRHLGELARVPLGDFAEERWGDSYLVAHRADLQDVLVTAVQAHPAIRLEFGASVEDVRFDGAKVTASILRDGGEEEVAGGLVVGADGVWSRLRHLMWPGEACRYAGRIAWRTVVDRDSAPGRLLQDLVPSAQVSAFLHPDFHLVAYPLRGGRCVNLVAVTRGSPGRPSWATSADSAALAEAMAGGAEQLARLAGAAAPWTVWPLFQVRANARWHDPAGLVLIGDAAHAMTPHSAQGAAMAIEDAVRLADRVAAAGGDMAKALPALEAERRLRVARVRRRGRFNQFVWHAWGPVALGRDLLLGTRSPASLAADLDWLYGWKPEDER